MARKKEKVGLWMIGAGGSVASTVALGLAAMRRGMATTQGMVTALPVFAPANFVDPATFVLGGHEVRPTTFLRAVQESHKRAKLFDEKIIERCAPELRRWQRNVRPGTLCGSGASLRKTLGELSNVVDSCPSAAVERLAADVVAFGRRHRLDHIIVIHLASTEPPLKETSVHVHWNKLERSMNRKGSRVVPSSTLYALAAIEANASYINFTPSAGIGVPAVRELAEQRGISYMGNDGKTGESLVKTVLAPMFAMRNLAVRGWVGQNILGNRDGEALRNPDVRRSKIQTKDKIVSQIMGYKPTSNVSIDYVPSLDDWKVAWDFIHFEGFMGTLMSLQFTWQGSDSILAAPLVIDLARLAAWERRYQRSGVMGHLAFFFKDPMKSKAYSLFDQWSGLIEHVCGATQHS